MPDVICLNLIRNRRAGPDQLHFTLQYIDELRKFIQAGFAQERSDSGNPGVMSQLVNAFTVSVRWLFLRLTGDQFLNIRFVDGGIVVHLHGSEFQEHKRSTMLADPSLPKEHWSIRRCFDCRGNRQERWQEKYQR